MVAKITEIIDDELSRAGEADGNRVPILGVMADVRGTLGLSRQYPGLPFDGRSEVRGEIRQTLGEE